MMVDINRVLGFAFLFVALGYILGILEPSVMMTTIYVLLVAFNLLTQPPRVRK